MAIGSPSQGSTSDELPVQRTWLNWFFAWFVDARALWRDARGQIIFFVIVWVFSALYFDLGGLRGLGNLFTKGLGALNLTAFPMSLFNVLQIITLQRSPQDQQPSIDFIGWFIFFGVPVVAIFVLLPTVLPFARLLFIKKERKQEWQVALASTFSDHVIVCGLGRVGIRVVSRLIRLGERVVVIQQDWDGDFVQQAVQMHVPVIWGDATKAEFLRQARIKRAKAVVAVVDGDLTDVDVAIAARKLNPGIRLILRAFNEEMDRNLENTFGRNSVYSSSTVAAPTFAAATQHRGLDYVVPIEHHENAYLLGVATMPLKGMGSATTLERFEAEFNVRVLGKVAGLPMLKPEQTVAVIGRLPDVESARVRCEGGFEPRQPSQGDLIIVTGLGKVGFRVVSWLCEYRTRPQISVILRPEDTRPELLSRLNKLGVHRITQGDARDAGVLKQAGIEQAAVLAAVTSEDQLNLQIALEARQLHPGIHIVLRTFSVALAENMNMLFNIHTTYSTSELSSATLAAAGAVGDIERAWVSSAGYFASQRQDVVAGDQLTGHTLADLRASRGLLGVWLRQGAIEERMPALTKTLAPGDEVVFVKRIGN